MRAAGNRSQSVQWIPFKRARGKLPVGVIDERFAAAPGNSHTVVIRGRVPVHIGRLDCDHVLASSDRGSCFKAVIAFNRCRTPVYIYGGQRAHLPYHGSATSLSQPAGR